MAQQDKSYLHDKKRNMQFWDRLEQNTCGYLEDMIEFGSSTIPDIDEDKKMEISKEVLSLVVNRLEECGANFPYVDENY